MVHDIPLGEAVGEALSLLCFSKRAVAFCTHISNLFDKSNKDTLIMQFLI